MSHFSVLVIGDDVKTALRPYQENNMSDCPAELLEFVEDECCDFDPKNGKRGYWENPNAKWDWWTVGGRYSGRLIVKGENIAHDSAMIGDLDFDAMQADTVKKWTAAWDAASRDDGGPIRELIFGVDPDKVSREDHIARAAKQPPLSCFALVKDGKWYERGEMGWWACVSNEKDADDWNAELGKLLSDLPPDTRITVVDCHI